MYKMVKKKFVAPVAAGISLLSLALTSIFEAIVGWITVKWLDYVWHSMSSKKENNEKTTDQ